MNVFKSLFLKVNLATSFRGSECGFLGLLLLLAPEPVHVGLEKVAVGHLELVHLEHQQLISLVRFSNFLRSHLLGVDDCGYLLLLENCPE